MSRPQSIIGVDESGKGDFFGPLVVAALLTSADEEKELVDLGARDSKLMADRKLLGIDRQLRDRFEHALIILPPEEYNERYEHMRNLNKLLAWGHAAAIERTLQNSSADLAISDKFGKSKLVEDALRGKGVNIPLKQIVRGEAVPQVAAASILARAALLREINNLSEACGVVLPLGAAPKVDQAGRTIVQIHGVKILRRLAKLHFKNYQRVVNPTLFS
ncbi:MAG: ribonuclease HIII [Candidatus Zixiibacteriota bacterium]|nr:MAG: ribonuclease HIII [candidate division Zixibacteria bacterium]